MSTSTVEHIVTETTDVPADASHIVRVPPGEPDQTPQAYVLRARIEGFPVTAECGYVFVPQKDPKPLPVCQTCLDLYEAPGERSESDRSLPDA